MERRRLSIAEPQPLPDSLTIHDAEHTPYESIESESLYAFPLGGEVEAEEQVPVLDSTAQLGAIEGSVAIFMLPASASENRERREANSARSSRT